MESEHLAPHGVPGGFKPMSRSRRNSTEDVQAAVTQPNPMDDPGTYQQQQQQQQQLLMIITQQTPSLTLFDTTASHSVTHPTTNKYSTII